MTPGFAAAAEAERAGRRQRRSAATAKTATNAARSRSPSRGRGAVPAGRGTTRSWRVVVGRDASESANATSLAVWKRFSRSFSRQCRTMWSSAGETLRPDCVSSGGSSFRIAAIVSLAVSRLNALWPESSS